MSKILGKCYLTFLSLLVYCKVVLWCDGLRDGHASITGQKRRCGDSDEDEFDSSLMRKKKKG